MKRLFLLIIFMGFFTTPTFAYCNYQNQCATSPYANPNAGMVFADATGANNFVETFANSLIKNELKKATNQDFEVAIKVFGLNELLQGQFKSLTVSGKDIEIEGFHFSSIKAQTLCPYNRIDINTKPVSIKENLVLGVSAELTAQNLKDTLDYSNYSYQFSKIDVSDLGLSAFRVYSPTIEVKDGKLYFTINATPVGYKPMDISIGANINASKGRLLTSQVEFINMYTGFELTQFSKLLGKYENLNFKFKLIGNKESELQVEDIKINGDKIYLNGTIFIPKTTL